MCATPPTRDQRKSRPAVRRPQSGPVRDVDARGRVLGERERKRHADRLAADARGRPPARSPGRAGPRIAPSLAASVLRSRRRDGVGPLVRDVDTGRDAQLTRGPPQVQVRVVRRDERSRRAVLPELGVLRVPGRPRPRARIGCGQETGGEHRHTVPAQTDPRRHARGARCLPEAMRTRATAPSTRTGIRVHAVVRIRGITQGLSVPASVTLRMPRVRPPVILRSHNEHNHSPLALHGRV